MFKFSAVGVLFSFSTSGLKIGELECEGEIGGDGEGVLLLEWPIDLDFLAIHSSGSPSSATNIDASKILAPTLGITTQFEL